MAYKGTVATYGRGVGIVIATGMDTKLGKIAELLRQGKATKTPLQQRLATFGIRLALLVLAVCAIIFVVGLLRGEQPVLMFLTAVSLTVAAIPEALPAVATVTLAIGARKLVTKNALIRRLPAVEMLGSATFIYPDKNAKPHACRSVLRRRALARRHRRRFSGPAVTALALNNDASRNHEGQLLGDPTEIALY